MIAAPVSAEPHEFSGLTSCKIGRLSAHRRDTVAVG
jgi:hypothetical protein